LRHYIFSNLMSISLIGLSHRIARFLNAHLFRGFQAFHFR
jgi:hypothetical protein